MISAGMQIDGTKRQESLSSLLCLRQAFDLLFYRRRF